MIHAYKLVRVRPDGTLGPLFIGRDLILAMFMRIDKVLGKVSQ